LAGRETRDPKKDAPTRARIDRVLNAKGNVTIETLQRAARIVGRELRLELV